jgi:hypothetical protein
LLNMGRPWVLLPALQKWINKVRSVLLQSPCNLSSSFKDHLQIWKVPLSWQQQKTLNTGWSALIQKSEMIWKEHKTRKPFGFQVSRLGRRNQWSLYRYSKIWKTKIWNTSYLKHLGSGIICLCVVLL